MNPFNNNTANLSQNELSERKRKKALNQKIIGESSTKLKMGSGSIHNIHMKPSEKLVKTWNSTFTDASDNSFKASNDELLKDIHRSYIELNYKKDTCNFED